VLGLRLCTMLAYSCSYSGGCGAHCRLSLMLCCMIVLVLLWLLVMLHFPCLFSPCLCSMTCTGDCAISMVMRTRACSRSSPRKLPTHPFLLSVVWPFKSAGLFPNQLCRWVAQSIANVRPGQEFKLDIQNLCLNCLG
jgi:hypothetical protein